MKKILFLIVLCAIVSFSSSAFATTEITDAGTTIGSVTFQPSPGTKFYAAATVTTYDCASKHTGGDLFYTSDEENPGIDPSNAGVPNPAYKGVDITSETGAISVN